VDRDCVLAERAPDRRARDRAAAERDHRRLAPAQRVDRDRLLEHTELQLAAPREQLGNRLARAVLELAVEIDELAAEPARELDPERRLARAHEADEREVPV
jgi:hypothetical protein